MYKNWILLTLAITFLSGCYSPQPWNEVWNKGFKWGDYTATPQTDI